MSDNDGTKAFENLMSVMSDAENGVERKGGNVSSSGVKSMETILENFNTAIQEASEYTNKPDKSLDQVKDTKVISEKAISIGDYQIEKTDGVYALYDENNSVLVDNVLLYETVYAIASHLYQGHTFSSSKIVNLLYNNSRYEKHLNEARMNKSNYNKYKTHDDFDAMDLEESKFEENRYRARSFKKNILNEYKNLGK